MAFDELTDNEKQVVYECLKASAQGPFFPDWEFHTLMGVQRKEVENFVSNWPNLDWEDESVDLAINNSFAHLLGYPHHISEKEWGHFITVSPDEVLRVFQKWRK